MTRSISVADVSVTLVGCKRGTSKLQCRNGKQENIELQNAQRLPASAFDRHSEDIAKATEEIKVCSYTYSPTYMFWLHTKPTRELVLSLGIRE